MMSGDGSLVYWSCETSHYFFHHHNADCLSEDEVIEVSVSDGRFGHMYLYNRHSFSHNSGVYYSSDNGIYG